MSLNVHLVRGVQFQALPTGGQMRHVRHNGSVVRLAAQRKRPSKVDDADNPLITHREPRTWAAGADTLDM